MAILSTDLAEIESFLSSNQINRKDICLVGSLSLANIGIRENKDIDLIIQSAVRKEKFNNNNTITISNKIDIVNSPWSSIFLDDDIIENDKLHSIIKGYKVVIPELLYHKKIWLNREKDQTDVLELYEFAKMSKTWDWTIIVSHLPKKNLIKKVFFALKNRLKAVRESFKKRILSSSIHQDAVQVIDTNLLLSKQIKSINFNRYDLMVRYMAIESVLAGNEDAFDLYNKMQEKRGNSPYKNPLETFKSLIKEIQQKGFNMHSPIVVNKQMQIIDGAHRFACALYFNTKQIPIKIVKNNTDFYYGIAWFKKNKFSDSEISLLKEKKEEIFLKKNLYFEVILWPPVAMFFDDIQEEIKKEHAIISSKTYTDYPDFESYVNALYAIDDIKQWKVKMKLEGMKKYPLTFRRILISIIEPNFRHKQVNNHLISQKVEQLKKQIRKKYAPKVEDYFYDIIIHIGDNYEHSKSSSILARQFNLT